MAQQLMTAASAATAVRRSLLWTAGCVVLALLVAGCSASRRPPVGQDDDGQAARRAAVCSEAGEPLSHRLPREPAEPRAPADDAKEERPGRSSPPGLDICQAVLSSSSTPEELEAAARACRGAWDDWVGRASPFGPFQLDSEGFRPVTTVPSAAADAETADVEAAVAPTYWGRTITAIEVTGLRSLPEPFVRPQILTAVGRPLEAETLRADLRRLWGLEALEDVQVSATLVEAGVSLTFALVERPLIGEVFLDGDADELGDTPQLRRLTGGVFQPARLHRELERIRLRYANRGHLRFAGAVRIRRLAHHAVDVCFVIEPGPRFVLERFDFDGNDHVPDAALQEQVDTLDDRVNVAGGVYRADLLEANIQALQALFYEHGCLDAVVGRPQVALTASRGAVSVTVPVYEGPAYSVGEVTFEGDLVAPEAEYHRRLGIETGQLFVRSRIMAGLEAVMALHHERTGAAVPVTPESEMDREQHRVNLRFVVGGP